MSEGGLWTRLRHGYGNASAALSQLSISGEKDGENENDTVIHHSLVRYYQHQGHVPTWLDVNANLKTKYSHHPNNSQSSLASQRSSDVQRNPTARGGSALEDIYKRREQRQQQQMNAAPPTNNIPPPPAGHRMPPRAQTIDVMGGSGNPPQRNDRFKNKLKSAGRANW